MIKNIFFDFNGTILDDTKLCYECEAEMLSKEGLKQVSFDFYRDNFCFPVLDYYKKVGFNVDGQNYSRLSKMFFELYLKKEKEETKLFDGFIDLLKKLKREGFRLYILTASEKKILINQLTNLGILNYFDGFAASDNLAASGKIEYGKEFIKNNDINIDESVLIGDTYHDYEVAKAIGLKCVLFSKGHNSKRVLEKAHTKIVDSYDGFYDYVKNYKQS